MGGAFARVPDFQIFTDPHSQIRCRTPRFFNFIKFENISVYYTKYHSKTLVNAGKLPNIAKSVVVSRFFTVLWKTLVEKEKKNGKINFS